MPVYRIYANITTARIYEVEAESESAARQAWSKGLTEDETFHEELIGEEEIVEIRKVED